MQLHRDWLMDDLKRLQTDRAAMKNLAAELETLETEFAALKATAFDKMPSGSGNNSQLDKIEQNLAKREELTKCLNATVSHVKFMNDLLQQLAPGELELIEKLVVRHSSTAEKMAEQYGIDPRQIYNRKRDAIDKLLRLRFGVGYKP